MPLLVAALLCAAPSSGADARASRDTSPANDPGARGVPLLSDPALRARALALASAPRIVAAFPHSAPGDAIVPDADGTARVTFSPNGDGTNEYALVVARATAGSSLQLVAAVDVRGYTTVWRSRPLTVGGDRQAAFAWNGASGRRQLSDGSYDLFVCARGAAPPCGTGRVVAHVRRLSIWVPSTRSFAAGTVVPVDVDGDAPGPLTGGVYLNDRVRTRVARFRLRAGANRVRIPHLPGGLYRIGVSDGNGDRRYAPLVVRGGGIARPPSHTALVIEPFLTWRAYNLVDSNRDGHPDSWYADLAHHRTVPLVGPFEVPGQLVATCTSCLVGDVDYTYAHGFMTWLGTRRRQARFITDLEATALPQAVLDRYAAVVLPGHTEYYEARLWSLLRDYRDAGGRIASLSANALYASVTVAHGIVHLVARPDRSPSRSDFALLGAGYVFCCDHTGGTYRLASDATRRAPWLFAGTGLRGGEAFGSVRGEIDDVTPARGPVAAVLARVEARTDDGGSVTGAMGLLGAPQGGEVFTAGMTGFVANIRRAGPIRRLLTNLWRHLLATR